MGPSQVIYIRIYQPLWMANKLEIREVVLISFML